jgi:hypothetical protein
MPFEAILNEVEQLHKVSMRLDGLAEEHPLMSSALITIAGSVRNTATLLGVLVATKGPKLVCVPRALCLASAQRQAKSSL